MTLPIHNPAPELCRRLRTKQAFTHQDYAEPWQEATSTTAAYWCLKTMSPAGPDDAFVHPQSCRAGRACFEAIK